MYLKFIFDGHRDGSDKAEQNKDLSTETAFYAIQVLIKDHTIYDVQHNAHERSFTVWHNPNNLEPNEQTDCYEELAKTVQEIVPVTWSIKED